VELEPQELERVFRERACGLDVHFAFVTACLIVPGKGKRLRILEETFETNVKGLKRLKAWLTEHQCEAVGMEATGVYWMPVYAALEGAGFDLEVANPLQIKSLGGRKADRKDARWIAEQVRHGRIKRSFVPPPNSGMPASWPGSAVSSSRPVPASAMKSSGPWPNPASPLRLG